MRISILIAYTHVYVYVYVLGHEEDDGTIVFKSNVNVSKKSCQNANVMNTISYLSVA